MNYLLADIYWEDGIGATIEQQIPVTASAYRFNDTILYYFESDVYLQGLENYNPRIIDSEAALKFAQSCILGSMLNANGLIDSPKFDFEFN
jgi:hypothetical protein